VFEQLSEDLLDLEAEEKSPRLGIAASPASLCISLCLTFSCSCSSSRELLE
jgi:hypothetical protein